jgi:Zn-dependent protease
MRFAGGYLEVGRFRGAPIRLHWSLPLGALLVSRFRFAPGVWVALFGLILLHEMGHAVLARQRRLTVLALDVHALGGLCRYAGFPSELDVAIVAWGGVLAQLAVLAVALVVKALVPVQGPFLWEVLDVLVWTNLWMIALNLLPVAGFDGVEAWKLWRLWRLRRPSPVAKPAAAKKPRPSHLRVVESPPSDISAEMRRLVDEAARDARERERRNRLN